MDAVLLIAAFLLLCVLAGPTAKGGNGRGGNDGGGWYTGPNGPGRRR